MTLTSFTKLLGYIHDSLLVDSDMASLCGGEIAPEIQLYCTLRYMAGGSYSDVQFFTGISTASFYRVVWRTIRAIVQCKQLSIRFPKTAEEGNAAADGFASVSDQRCIFNCVAAVDGYLIFWSGYLVFGNNLAVFAICRTVFVGIWFRLDDKLSVASCTIRNGWELIRQDFGLSFCWWFLGRRHRLATVGHIIDVHLQLYVGEVVQHWLVSRHNKTNLVG
jgi:hypothetical protein